MIHYIIQVLIFQTLFLAVYDLFLKKETFFQWNRTYLIVSSILAYIIPFVKIESTYVQENFIALPEIILNPEVIFLSEVNLVKENTSIFTLQNFYILGITIASLLFIYKISLIFIKIYKNTILRKKDYNLVILPKQQTAFSFFKYLFLGKSLFEKDHQHIIKHELTHIKQKHSIDLIYFELQKIIFWFNPFSYLFQNRISTLHEYIADDKTIKEENKQSFFESLLNQTFQIEKFSFVNQFYKKSLIKKRIIMATKNKSKEILKLKYLLLVPIIFIMFGFTAIIKNTKDKNSNKIATNPNLELQITNKANKKYILNKEESINLIKRDTSITIKNQGKYFRNLTSYKGDTLFSPYKMDTPPRFKEKLNHKYNDKQSLLIDLAGFTISNINKETIINAKIKGKGVSVSFIINKKGKVENIDTRFVKNKDLKDKIIIMLNDMPKIIPGKHNGKLVNTKASIFIYNHGYEREIIDFSVIEKKPIYPGCEDTLNKEKCFNKSISSYIAKEFNMDLVNSLGLPNGKTRIVAQFIINEQGNTYDAKVRAPHKKIIEHVKHIIYLMPQMQSGEKNGEKVSVRYNLPIVFEINNNKDSRFSNNISSYEEVEIIEDVPFSVIDEVPVYPGCSGNNEELKKCISKNITKHVSKNFNINLAQNLGLSAGKKRISVQFKIDNNGYISNVRARAPHPKLQEEAIRIIKMLPKMKAGKKDGNPVNVRYNLPIIFNVQGDTVLPPAPPAPIVPPSPIKNNNIAVDIPFSVIDEVPVYPGCLGNNEELKKCISENITKHVSTNFNTALAKKIGLPVGKKRISVQFKIDNNGYISDVKARAPHPILQEEAIRVIKSLPKMEPGKQDGKAVNVRYNLPIIFNVEK